MALLYAASAIVFVWGAAHIIATRSALAGFDSLSTDNRRILIMEWVAEGITLCFIGVLVALVVSLDGRGSVAGLIVYRSSGVVLLALALVAVFTGARTPDVPFKICPFVEAGAAVLLFVGSLT